MIISAKPVIIHEIMCEQAQLRVCLLINILVEQTISTPVKFNGVHSGWLDDGKILIQETETGSEGRHVRLSARGKVLNLS